MTAFAFGRFGDAPWGGTLRPGAAAKAGNVSPVYEGRRLCYLRCKGKAELEPVRRRRSFATRLWLLCPRAHHGSADTARAHGFCPAGEISSLPPCGLPLSLDVSVSRPWPMSIRQRGSRRMSLSSRWLLSAQCRDRRGTRIGPGVVIGRVSGSAGTAPYRQARRSNAP